MRTGVRHVKPHRVSAWGVVVDAGAINQAVNVSICKHVKAISQLESARAKQHGHKSILVDVLQRLLSSQDHQQITDPRSMTV